jgi:imidazolonepropionase-like amidohydrolase
MSSYYLKGRVIDSVADVPLENGVVLIREDKIEYAGSALNCPQPPDAVVIEVPDGTILPGFIDCHAHFIGEGPEKADPYTTSPYYLLLNAAHDIGILLDAGFTSAREMGAFGPHLKQAVDRNVVRGPRIMAGARILSVTAGHGDMDTRFSVDYVQESSPFTWLVDGVDECLKGARLQFREGAEFIKICATGGVSSQVDAIDDVQFSMDEIRAIVAEAERHSTYVAAHCTGMAGAYQALQAGVKSIEHGIFLDERCVELMVKNDATLVTTLSISFGIPNMKGRLPDWLWRKGCVCAEANRKSIELVHQAGVRIALGTDYSNSPNTPYAENGKEFAAIVSAGFTPMEAIKIGTVNGSHLMKMSDRIGTLQAGKLADVVIVQGNPLEDINLLAHKDHVKVVFKNGKIEKNINQPVEVH